MVIGMNVWIGAGSFGLKIRDKMVSVGHTQGLLGNLQTAGSNGNDTAASSNLPTHLYIPALAACAVLPSPPPPPLCCAVTCSNAKLSTGPLSPKVS